MDFDTLSSKFCDDIRCKKSDLQKLLSKKEDILLKLKDTVIDNSNYSFIIAELMAEAKRIKGFSGEQKKACVMFVTENILNCSDLIDEKIDDFKMLMPVMIENLSVLIKSKKNKFLKKVFNMFRCFSSKTNK